MSAVVPQLSTFFSASPTIEVPRLAISLDALQKCGKTYWALMTAPDPIAVVSNDPGTAHIRNKALALGRRVSMMEVHLAEPDKTIRKQEDIDKAQWQLWVNEWARVKAAHQAIIADKTIRTLVWDEGASMFDLAQLSHFGKLTGNTRQDKRTDLNADFHKLFWDLYKGRPDLNIILIHKLKKQYVKNSDPNKPADWSGKYEREGFNKIGYYVDLSLRLGWDSVKKDYYSEIDAEQSTRYGSELCGKRWYGAENSFTNLALEIFPETILTPEWWGIK